MISLETGSIVWAELGEGVGREQGGRRPVVVISSADHRSLVPDLIAVVPATRVDRGWPNHVELLGETGLKARTFAMTEQPRAIGRERIHGYAGTISAACLSEIATWIDDWLVSPTG